MEDLRTRLDRLVAQMRQERASFIAHWRELSEYILPRQSRFLTTDRNKGDKRNQKIIDTTATLAARTLASGMMAGVTSPARPWFRLTTQNPGQSSSGEVKAWLSAVESRMREVFNRSNLYNALPMCYQDLGVFGTTAMLVIEDDEDLIRCYPLPVGSYMLGNSARLSVDTMAREFQMTVRQLVYQFGRDACSDQVRNLFDRGQTEDWIDVVHVIMPNEDFRQGPGPAKRKRFLSVHYEAGADKGKFLRESGFDEFSVLAPRWSVIGEDIYGHSPAMDALGDIKALQLEQKRKAQAIDKLVNPPMAGPSSLKTQRASLLPGDVTYIDVMQGGQKFEPAYVINPHLEALISDIRENQDRIRRSFFEDLFLMIANDQRSNITAREIEERHEEKLLMLGPVLERLNDELLDPLIDRVFGIMLRQGAIPEPPRALQGQEIRVEYISVMAQAMKMVGLSSVERLLGFVGNLAGANPSVLDKIDGDAAVDAYAEMVGAPPGIVVGADVVTKIRKEREQAAAQAQAMQAMQTGAQGAKLLSETDTGGDNALTRMLGVA